MKLQDYPYRPNHTAEDYATVRSFLEKKEKFNATANFIMVGENGIIPCVAKGCHASMGQGAGTVLLGTECGVVRRNDGHPYEKKIDKDFIRPFFYWFLNRSFASHFILNKDDPEWAWINGFVFSSQMPSPLLQNCLITSRHFYELSKPHFDLFNALEPRIGGDLAYLIAMNTTLVQNKALLSCVVHRAFGMFSNMDCVEAFMAHDFGEALKKQEASGDVYSKRATIYGGFHYCNNRVSDSIYGATPKGTYVEDLIRTDKTFHDRLASYRESSGTSKSVVNPFLMNSLDNMLKTNPYVLSEAETMNVLVPYFEERYGSSVQMKEVA